MLVACYSLDRSHCTTQSHSSQGEPTLTPLGCAPCWLGVTALFHAWFCTDSTLIALVVLPSQVLPAQIPQRCSTHKLMCTALTGCCVLSQCRVQPQRSCPFEPIHRCKPEHKHSLHTGTPQPEGGHCFTPAGQGSVWGFIQTSLTPPGRQGYHAPQQQ